jgi:hypothetical protein
MQQVYPALTPYLKGLHLTIDSWRDNREEEGWQLPKVLSSYPEGFWDEYMDSPDLQHDRPQFVQPVPRYNSDLVALHLLLQSVNPPIRFVHQSRIHTTFYGFVDASSSGLGSSFTTSNGTHYTYGVWGRDQDDVSPNYRELNNLVTSIETLISDGTLVGAEVYVFTDNFTAEAAFYKGNTSSKTLFDLVLRLRTVEMSGLIQLQVIHVAGTCMISQGINGLSRRCLTKGVLTGASMLSYIPLNLSAVSRHPSLLPWLQDWTRCNTLLPLAPTKWFGRGHGIKGGQTISRGLWHPTPTTDDWLLWCPPPAAADVAIEELMYSRHKWTHLNHIFIVPRLATHLWRKKLYKTSDIVFKQTPGSRPFWPSHEHEPLLIGLTLHFSLCFPWQLRQSPPILALGQKLQGVWQKEGGDERAILRQLSALPGTLESM